MASHVSLKILLTFLALVSFFESGSVRAQNNFRISRLDHLVITVTDARRSVDFYTNVLGMTLRRRTGLRSVYFGQSKINIHVIGREALPKARRPTPGSADLCFITQTDIRDVINHLRSHNVRVILGPVGRPGALGRITSVYFRDPDGNLIEVSNY